jgi:hypothetical protein
MMPTPEQLRSGRLNNQISALMARVVRHNGLLK